MGKAMQPVMINDLEFDALIDQTHTLESSIPQYPVEDGFNVSDAIILSPEKVAMTLYVTNTPVTWYDRHGGNQYRVDEVCKQMQEIYFSRTPVTVTTTDATWDLMGIESLEISKSLEEGYSRQITVSLVKIRITKLKTTTIPPEYARSNATKEKAGEANTTTKTKTSKKKSSGSTKKAASTDSSASGSGSSGSSGSASKSSGSTSKESGQSALLKGLNFLMGK